MVTAPLAVAAPLTVAAGDGKNSNESFRIEKNSNQNFKFTD